MSKKKKVSSVKVKASSKNKKAVKAVSKSKPAKKAPSKKQKIEKKKPLKKPVVKAKKAKVAPKKAAPKSNKKVVKPSNSAKKKVVAKPVNKKTSKVAVKKTVVKKAAKPVVKKAVKVPAKKTPAKPVKASKPVVAKKEVKKEVKKVAVFKPIEKKVVAPKSKDVSEPATTKAVNKKEVKVEDDKKNDVLAINNMIPKVEISALSASKIASITSSITNPVKKQGAYAVKVEKEPNGKFEIEFGFRASAEMLYEFFSTASGLSEWFCDDVNIRNGIYTFIWDGQMQQARLLKTIDNQLARYQWVDKTDGSYFEFRIQRDDLTNDISLIVTDFADTKGDQESAKLLWHSQVEKLMHVIGSIF